MEGLSPRPSKLPRTRRGVGSRVQPRRSARRDRHVGSGIRFDRGPSGAVRYWGRRAGLATDGGRPVSCGTRWRSDRRRWPSPCRRHHRSPATRGRTRDGLIGWLMPLSGWTGPSPFPAHRRGRNQSLGALAHLLVSESQSGPAAVVLAQSMAAGAGLPSDALAQILTYSGRSIAKKLAQITPISIRKLVGESDPLVSITFIEGPSRGIVSFRRDDHLESPTCIVGDIEVPAPEAHDRSGYERLCGAIESVAGLGELLFAAVNVDWSHDPHGRLMWPRPRHSWKPKHFYHLAPGYYLTNYVGERIGAALVSHAPGRPTHLCDGSGGDVAVVGVPLPDDNSEEATRRSLLQVRNWLRPALPGWVVADGSDGDLRLHEGQPAPAVVASLLHEYLESAGLLDLEHIVNEARSLPGFAMTVSSRSSAFAISARSGSVDDHDILTAALEGSVNALVRGIEEGWLPSFVPFQCGPVELTDREASTVIQLDEFDIKTVEMLGATVSCGIEYLTVDSGRGGRRAPLHGVQFYPS